ncbi:protein ECERIFERUM 26-like isoform X1 [Hibiscus syriacus]|nr:protein ECERIFERUM 26-like isoform X1 [Hibiscus syriacus]
MVSPQQHHDHVYDLKLLSVGPGHVTGSDVVHDLTGLDLAMKLHYLKAVYLFSSHAAEGLTIMNMKEPMFCWCNDYFMTCGRIKRSEPSGRPYIKCNDCGIRVVEGVCDKTLDEWIEMEDGSRWNLLVYHRVIGPELSFSPLVYLQVTWFKCGGISLGISWAHLLGDAFSVSDFVNNWGRCMATLKANGSPTVAPRSQTTVPKPQPLSAKQVNHVGDLWVIANNCKMETFSFNLTTQHLSNLEDEHNPVSAFNLICALIWRSIAKFREGFEPQVVTVCRKDPNHDNNILGNTQVIRSIKADFSVVESDLNKLASLIAGDQNQGRDERNMIEASVEKDNGLTDYIIYGSNLTFVNLVNAGLYEMELKGKKPRFAYYSIQGVGDEGAVLVLPGPPPQGSTVIMAADEAIW